MMPLVKDIEKYGSSYYGLDIDTYDAFEKQYDKDKALDVKQKDLTTNVSKKAKPFGASKHNKARKVAFEARQRKKKRK